MHGLAESATTAASRRQVLRVAARACAAVMLGGCVARPRPTRIPRIGVIYDDPRPAAFDPFLMHMNELGD